MGNEVRILKDGQAQGLRMGAEILRKTMFDFMRKGSDEGVFESYQKMIKKAEELEGGKA